MAHIFRGCVYVYDYQHNAIVFSLIFLFLSLSHLNKFPFCLCCFSVSIQGFLFALNAFSRRWFSLCFSVKTISVDTMFHLHSRERKRYRKKSAHTHTHNLMHGKSNWKPSIYLSDCKKLKQRTKNKFFLFLFFFF